MPRFVPAVADERTALLAFLAQQRAALAHAVLGLTEEQAWSVPSASELSLAGLLKHGAVTERRWVVAALAGRPLPGLWPMTDPGADLTRAPGETVPALLAAYRRAAEETERIIAELPDLGVACANEQAAQWSARWVLLHLIEETARHAGHADVIRQSIDGAHAVELLARAEG
ncbi:DinB family protein [Kitasatospora sp. NBC_01287]|uniref:DinB family protein n=1 Tax=Kitasatospora sp. NBC_01287 TaxID=2903573 RepID=UPI002254DE6A|nr:DinB family protein [Kitasatospora sp. NBC_01287]MCX4745455.1 DinB family protein [Kitasatospora sp. NBC_01287]